MTDFFTLLEKKCKGKIDIESADFIKYSMEAASRLKALVSNLLTYSQVDASNRTFETTDFGELLEDVTDNLKTVIEETGAEIMHDPLPVLNADSIQIMQLFQNLIGNALKFRRGRPVVRVSAVRKDNEWFFSVKDNGIGLDMKYADSIFNSFQRLHSMKEYPGTGLGLAICKKIVERHGGRIWLDSKPGDGTVFYFTIPVSPPVRAAETVMPRQPESDGEKR
jgi:light-regulated signal transduction histidine kinase (bacteriophytochrome)